jgi:hypothetical protein
MHLKFENNAARKSRLRNVQSPRPCTSQRHMSGKKIRRLKIIEPFFPFIIICINSWKEWYNCQIFIQVNNYN